MSAEQVITWLSQARKRDQPVFTIPYANDGGAPKLTPLPNVGYLERLRLAVTASGAYATAGPTGVDVGGRFGGPVNRITLRAGTAGLLYDVSGFGTSIINALDATSRFGFGTLTPARAYNFVEAPGIAAFSNLWTYDIPVAFYLDTFPYPVGLYQTAIQGNIVTFDVRFNPIAGNAGNPGSTVYTGNAANLTNPAGAVAANMTYFDPIVAPSAQPYLGYLHTWREIHTPVSGDGDIPIPLPASNYYTRAIHYLVTGGAGALALDDTTLQRVRLVFGTNITPYDESRVQILSRMARQYGNLVLPGGVFTSDFYIDTMDERDFINAEAVTDLRFVVTLQGGTYTGGAYIRTIVEQLVEIGAPMRAGVVGPQGGI